MSVNEAKNYNSLKKQIKKQEEEVANLLREYNTLKTNKRKIEAKRVKQVLKAEKNQLKRLIKRRNTYIYIKSEMQKELALQQDYKEGRIPKIVKDAGSLKSKLKIRSLKGKYNKNIPSCYVDEIKETVSTDFSRAKHKRMDFGTFKKAAGTSITIAAMIVAFFMAKGVYKSINNAPKDLYPDEIPKLDEFSLLVKEVNGESNIPTNRPKENRETITPEFVTLDYSYENNEVVLKNDNDDVYYVNDDYDYLYNQTSDNNSTQKQSENTNGTYRLEDYETTTASYKIKK